MRARNARGFTLVEGLFAALLLSVVIVLIWQAVSQGMKREARLDFKLRAIQTAALACSRMGDDFSQLMPLNPRSGQRAVVSGVVFDRVSSAATAGPEKTPLDRSGVPVAQSVTYRHDPQRRCFLRDGQVIAGNLIDDMELTYEASSENGYMLRVDMDLVPEAEAGSKTPSRKAEYGFSFYSPQGSRALAQDSWVGDN